MYLSFSLIFFTTQTVFFLNSPFLFLLFSYTTSLPLMLATTTKISSKFVYIVQQTLVNEDFMVKFCCIFFLYSLYYLFMFCILNLFILSNAFCLYLLTFFLLLKNKRVYIFSFIYVSTMQLLFVLLKHTEKFVFVHWFSLRLSFD